MPNLGDMEAVARRELTVFYVLDISGSMQGEKIGKLNRAMEETLSAMQDVASKNSDALLKIAVLSFSSGAEWITAKGPEYMEDFVWEDLKAGGITDLGAALKELNSKLSKNEFLNSMTGNFLPVIIFMTDGMPTDDYKKQLDAIRQNRWFKNATKIGFAIGDDNDVDTTIMAEVVGNTEAVIKTDDLEMFSRMLRFVSVTSSMVCSQSRTSDEPIGGKDIVGQFIKENDDVKVEDITDEKLNDYVVESAAPDPEPKNQDTWDVDDWA